MPFKELITKWGFKVEKEPLDRLEKQIEGIKHSLEFLAAAEVVKGIYELTERFAHFAEELHVAALSAGLTVEEFQKLTFAAGHYSISQEEMSTGLARLSRNLQQARLGSEEANMAFQQAGLTPQQVLGFKTSGDALAALADRFRAIQDPIQKQALAMQLFGRGSTSFVAFLSQGSGAIHGLGEEAQKMGAILGEKNVEALVKAEHSLNDLWAVLKNIGATIASYFAPSIETITKSMLKFWEANQKLINVQVRAWVWDITFALGFIYETVKIVIQKFLDFAAAHQMLVRRVGEFIIALGLMALGIFAVQKALGFLKGAFELFETVTKPIEFGWEKLFKPGLFWIGGLIRGGLSKLLLYLATLTATAFPALSSAFLSLGAVIEATPIGWLLTGLAALVVILHDAYTLLFGSGKWEDTWISKAITAAKGFGSKALSFFGLGGDQKDGDNQKLSVDNIQKGISDFTRPLGPAISTMGGPGDSSTSVSAPVTMNIYGSNAKDIAKEVEDKFSQHMETHNRRLQNSFAPAQDY